MNKFKKNNGSWINRQERDIYVQKARLEGWRSRAVYKLKQIDEKERFLNHGMICVDVGSSPGSWSQFVTQKLKGNVNIVAVDILPMDPLPGVDFILGDFLDERVFKKMLQKISNQDVDLVMSDIAPNITGIRAVDQPKSMYLVELVLEFACKVLKPGGNLVCKVFQGAGFDDFIREARRCFQRVKIIKPNASRSGSREVYLVARNFNYRSVQL
tara:strand:- start:907 stop:1545 length:639 start_codon:yes stop_codon:yes gene_type:complete